MKFSYSLFLLVFTFLSTGLFAQTATVPSGSGTEGDPYLIASIENLYWVTQNSSAWGSHFKQTADIDLSDSETWNSGQGFTPIGNNTTSFTGVYDGDGHTVSNMFIDRTGGSYSETTYLGFMGRLEGTLKKLSILDYEVTGNQYMAGAAGYADGATVDSVITSGTVTATSSNIGGLIGQAYNTTINQSAVYGTTISGYNFGVGGLVGNINTGTVTLSSVTNSEIIGGNGVGGLVGSLQYSSISESFAQSVSVEGRDGGNIGGLVGYTSGSSSNYITDSYAVAEVSSAENNAGGLVGSLSGINVSNVYASSSVQGGNPSGGLAGYTNNASSLSSAFWNGFLGAPDNGTGTELSLSEMKTETTFSDSSFDFTDVWQIDEGSSFPYLKNNPPATLPGTSLVLSFPGNNSNLVALQPAFKWQPSNDAISYDLQVSEESDFSTQVIDETGLTDHEFQPSTSLSLNTSYYWRVREVTSGGAQDWTEALVFTTTLFSNGAGTPEDPYQITSMDQLAGISLDLTASYILMNDIDASVETGDPSGSFWNSGEGWTPLGSSSNQFSGSLDGNGFAIDGLFINRSSNFQGIFGYIGSTGQVTDLGVTNVSISANQNIGGIAGTNYGTISHSYTTGSINAVYGYAGGLVGANESDSEISYSFSHATVGGGSYNYYGGLVGYNSTTATISYSYAAGDVTGNGATGGLVGRSRGSITHSYASGAVSGSTNVGGLVGEAMSGSSVSTSYFNSDISPDNSQGTGLSATEMMHEASFSGFDFTDTWSIKESFSFPYLTDVQPDTLPGEQLSVVPGQSVSFDGGDDHIQVPNNAVFNGLAAATFETWVYLEGSGRNGLMENIEIDGGTVTGWWIDVNGDISTALETGSGNRWSDSGVNPSLNTWHHIAVSYDGTDFKIYLDGEDLSVTTDGGASSGSISSNTRPLVIGGTHWSGEYLNGKMNEVRLWNVVRTQDQIRENMFQELSGDETGLILYYPMDGSSGTTVTDKSTNGLYASLINGASWSEETPPFGTFITGNEGWRMLSSPGSGLSYGELLDTLWTQGFTGADVPNGASNVYTWSESTQSFTAIEDATDIPATGTGFLVYVFSDDDFDGTPDDFPKLLKTGNTQNSGYISPALSYTDTESPADDGWNFLGNPFETSIDWDAGAGLATTNLDASFYVWSDSANGGAGDYLSWNGSTGTFGTGNIAPFQGFWVKANAGSPELILNSFSKSGGGILRKKQPLPEVRFTISGSRFTNSAIVMFSGEATSDKDRLDAYKLQSLNKESLALFTQLEDGSALDINAIPNEFGERIDIPLDFELSTVGAIHELPLRLGWNLNALPEGLNAWLTDNETGEVINLTETSTYEFALGDNDEGMAKASEPCLPQEGDRSGACAGNRGRPNHGVLTPTVLKARSSGSEASPRFTLTFSYGSLVSNEPGDGLPDTFAMDQNYPNPFNPSTVIRYQLPVNSEVSLKVFDVLGREVATLIDGRMEAGYHQITFNARNLASGMYIYQLRTGSTVITRKLTLIK